MGALSALLKVFDPNAKQLKRIGAIAARVNELEPQMVALRDEQFPMKIAEYKERLGNGETLDDLLPECFALTREAAKRTLGERHHDVQIIGGIVLHEGKVAEMKTGEGKTLTATLPLVLNALEGKGAHLVTTNDFLVAWQAEWMGKVYEFLGLTVGHIQHDMKPEQRKEMYLRDITYVENSELGFDYLRDNMAWRQESLVLRDLHYAIVDEADSILVDEARTPLIISGQVEGGLSPDQLSKIARVVGGLKECTNWAEVQAAKQSGGPAVEPDGDFVVDKKFHQAHLTPRGQAEVEKGLANTFAAEIPKDRRPKLFFDESQGYDAEQGEAQPEEYEQHFEWIRAIEAAVKARALYERDKHYISTGDEIVIIDEFTGHPQPGRRFSDGIHEALEAKERVRRIRRPSQTLASITYQNFFRLYHKIAGMTGTAKTEEAEFYGIYKMPVVCVPPNVPVVRKDHPDVIFKTAEAKYRAIVAEIINMHVREQPVLVGTRTVEVSEYVSERLKPDALRTQAVVSLCQLRLEGKDHGLPREQKDEFTQALRARVEDISRSVLRPIAQALHVDPDPTAEANLDVLMDLLDIHADAPEEQARLRGRLAEVLRSGVPHEVLNGKVHWREGRVIAQAGRPGAVTIATNMAGRGVDIVLGGKPEDGRKFDPELQERVKRVGGLHVLGTERHESRRIDNQLRGRAGRQGDPGSSRFYISLEDELMRIFGPERFRFLFNSWPEEQALEHKMVTRSIERAQEKVELRNYDQRKNTLKYDDVMNKQREVIYRDRRRVLEGADISERILGMFEQTARATAQSCEAAPSTVRYSDALYLLARLPLWVARRELRQSRGVANEEPLSAEDLDLTNGPMAARVAELREVLSRKNFPESEWEAPVVGEDEEVEPLHGGQEERDLADFRDMLLDRAPEVGALAHVRDLEHLLRVETLFWRLLGGRDRSGRVEREPALPGIIRVLPPENLEDTPDWDRVVEQVAEAARQLYVWRERLVGAERMREDERNALLWETDRCWRDHLREMDYLRESIGLRGYGQRDPLLEYQREAFEYFGNLLEQIAQRTTRRLLRGTGHIDRHGVLLRNVQEGRGEEEEALPSRPTTFRKEGKEVGRNDPCPCGSGLKYKRCCGVKTAVKA